MLDVLKELFSYAMQRKKLWLLPLLATLLLAGILTVVAQYSAVAPFIYTLF